VEYKLYLRQNTQSDDKFRAEANERVKCKGDLDEQILLRNLTKFLTQLTTNTGAVLVV
jgi:hypothetical protein